MDAKFWLDLVQWAVTIGIGLFVWLDRGRENNRDRIDQLERRVVAAEESLRHAPTHDDIATLRAEVAGVQSTLARVTNTLDRIHDYLMNSKA